MRQDLKAVWHAPGCFFVAHVAPTLGHVAPDSEASRVFPQAAFGRHVGQRGARFKNSHNEKNRPMRSGVPVPKAHFQYLHCVSM